MSVEEIAERFQRETANHGMTILHDDGLYRHVRFTDQTPRHAWAYWFELITTPGALIFRGDGESFVFARIEDMFQFFRQSSSSWGINPSYWAEKLTSNQRAVRTYSPELFGKTVAKHLAEAEGDWPGVTAFWDETVNGELADPDYNTTYEDSARQALNDFEFGDIHKFVCSCGEQREFDNPVDAALWQDGHLKANRAAGHRASVETVTGFRFHDTWEWSFEDYDWWYLWACHAIVWGIGQYDAARSTSTAEVAS